MYYFMNLYMNIPEKRFKPNDFHEDLERIFHLYIKKKKQNTYFSYDNI